MNWSQFVPASIFTVMLMSCFGAPAESLIAGVTLAGGLSLVQKFVLRKRR
ncbi:MAG: hypothetical protein ABI759_03160 [Candidatus Solibacter sp.]